MNNGRQLSRIEDRVWSQLQRLKALAATDPSLSENYKSLLAAWSDLRQAAIERSKVIEAVKDAEEGKQ